MSEVRLVYSIVPDPYPILVSTSIDLNVTITNPYTSEVPIDHITIVIPTGENVGADLSQSDLPSPSYTNPDWDITVEEDGSTITITPQEGTTGLGGGATITFALNSITVNATSGNVQISIQEIYSSDSKSYVDKTHELTKRAADFPVTKFWADPPVLYNLDQPVTLKWECSAYGENYFYSVQPVGIPPTDCENDVNKCHSCADGNTGVTFQDVNQTTTYALYVLKANAEGNRSVEYTLNATVKVETPSFSDNSYQDLYFHGYCMLHWLAFNAVEDECKVMMDNQTVITKTAPVDTYEQGYLIPLLSYNPGTTSHQLTVTAYGQTDDTDDDDDQQPQPRGCLAALLDAVKPGSQQQAVTASDTSGPAVATHSFSNFIVNPSPNFITGISAPGNMDITLDENNPLVFVQNYDSNNVTVLDVATHSIKTNIAVGSSSDRHSGIGVTPDNKSVLVTNSASNNVQSIDIATLKVAGNPIPVGANPNGIVPMLAADKQTVLALVTSGDSNIVTVINVTASTTANVTLDYAIGGITTTPDGKYALVGHRDDNCMTVIDITDPSKPTKTVITGVTSPGSFTITLDSTTGINYAFVVNSANGSNSITVVDVNNNKVVGSITVGSGPTDVVATPDGTLALVANFDDNKGNTVSVLDISDPLNPQVTKTITLDTTGVVSNVLTYDGALAIVAYSGSTQTVTLIDVANLTTTSFDVGSAYRFVGRPLISPNDRYALVADRDNNRVLVL